MKIKKINFKKKYKKFYNNFVLSTARYLKNFTKSWQQHFFYLSILNLGKIKGSLKFEKYLKYMQYIFKYKTLQEFYKNTEISSSQTNVICFQINRYTKFKPRLFFKKYSKIPVSTNAYLEIAIKKQKNLFTSSFSCLLESRQIQRYILSILKNKKFSEYFLSSFVTLVFKLLTYKNYVLFYYQPVALHSLSFFQLSTRNIFFQIFLNIFFLFSIKFLSLNRQLKKIMKTRVKKYKIKCVFIPRWKRPLFLSKFLWALTKNSINFNSITSYFEILYDTLYNTKTCMITNLIEEQQSSALLYLLKNAVLCCKYFRKIIFYYI